MEVAGAKGHAKPAKFGRKEGNELINRLSVIGEKV